MICPNCGRQIDDDSRFCRFCGAEFIGEETVLEISPEEDLQEPSEKLNKSKRPSNIRLVFVLAVIITSFAVLMIVLMSKGVFSGSIGGEVVTDAVGEEIREGRGSADISVMDTDGTVRQIETDRSLLTAESILREYTAVMNQLKNDAVGFTKIRYQNLPAEHQSLGGLGGLVLPIIEKYVTSKTASNPVVYTAGNADKLPVINSSYGCLLTDATKIKNAYCEIIEGDMYKLVITVCDELNPEILSAGATTSSGAVSGIFDPYDAAEQIKSISSLALSDIDFNYTGCTVTLIYDNDTKQVQSINQSMNIDITANAYITDIKARIVDITEYTQFEY